jgi:hypothetical protein
MSGAIPSLTQYAFMAWCLVKYRDNFTFVTLVSVDLYAAECYVGPSFMMATDVHVSNSGTGWLLYIQWKNVQGCIQKLSDWVDNEIYAYKNKHSLRKDTRGYGSKTH